MTDKKGSAMRVAILGAGAMGSIFGAELTSHGVDTLLIDVNAPLVNRLNHDGVVIRRGDKERQVRVRATIDPKGEGPVDLLVVFVKCWATDDAMKLAAPLIGGDTSVLSLQNGWGNGEKIARHVPDNRVLLGVTYHSGTVTGLGVVDHTAVGSSYIGPHRGNDLAAARAIASSFTDAGLPTEATAEIIGKVWRKLMLNVSANPVAALTGLRSGQLMQDPHVDRLMTGLAREAVAVARASGHPFDAEETIAYVRESLRAAGPATASMRQDVMAGRPTEIDVITGAIIEAAESHGIDVPLNRAIHALIKGYEAARPDPGKVA